MRDNILTEGKHETKPADKPQTLLTKVTNMNATNNTYEAILNEELSIEAKRAKQSIKRLSKAARARAEAAATERFEALPKTRAPRTNTKRAVCAEIFTEMLGERRKDVIAAMMERTGLSKAGASTYFQNLFSGKWDHAAAA